MLSHLKPQLIHAVIIKFLLSLFFFTSLIAVLKNSFCRRQIAVYFLSECFLNVLFLLINLRLVLNQPVRKILRRRIDLDSISSNGTSLQILQILADFLLSRIVL